MRFFVSTKKPWFLWIPHNHQYPVVPVVAAPVVPLVVGTVTPVEPMEPPVVDGSGARRENSKKTITAMALMATIATMTAMEELSLSAMGKRGTGVMVPALL